MAGGKSAFVRSIFRRRRADSLTSETVAAGDGAGSGGGSPKQARLARHMGPFDLTALGVGSTLGAGIYAITGVVARNDAGPAIVLSFAIAGFASILSGMCYAEFGSRVPKAGSAYVYSYVTVGELIAWITGWNLILEYIIGAASVARVWSGYLDNLLGNVMSDWVEKELGGWTVPGLGSYPDFFALIITMLLSLLVAFGVKESARFNNILTGVNMAVILFVIIAGATVVTTGNWSTFAPYGAKGVFSGAATCFYAYIGFDVIATSAEETVNPSRNIPIGIIGSLVVCALSYIGVSAIITLMVPYDQINVDAPLSAAFGVHGMHWAKVLIAIGALCGLSTSLMAAIFPLPRVVYAIASDGLLFPWLGKVSPRFKTPANATFVCGAFAGVMAFMFDISALADMMSIGTLMSYTLVSACVLILRYRFEPTMDSDDAEAHLASNTQALLQSYPSEHSRLWAGYIVHTERAATAIVTAFAVAVSVISFLMHAGATAVDEGAWWAMAIMGVMGAIMIVCTVLLLRLPRTESKQLKFKAPWVPIMPLVSVSINIYLLFSLSKWTWVRFGVWLVIGLAIYFAWGIKHSRAGPTSGRGGKRGMSPFSESSGSLTRKADGHMNGTGDGDGGNSAARVEYTARSPRRASLETYS